MKIVDGVKVERFDDNYVLTPPAGKTVRIHAGIHSSVLQEVMVQRIEAMPVAIPVAAPSPYDEKEVERIFTETKRALDERNPGPRGDETIVPLAVEVAETEPPPPTPSPDPQPRAPTVRERPQTEFRKPTSKKFKE
jgi:hypothetical protein